MVEITWAHGGLFIVLLVLLLIVIYLLGQWWLRRNLEQKFVLTCSRDYAFPPVTLAEPTVPEVFDRTLAYNLMVWDLEVTLASGCKRPLPTPAGGTIIKQISTLDPKAGVTRVFAVVWQGPVTVVSFPGTITPSEWFDDADLVQVPPVGLGSYQPGSLVHRGFYNIYQGLREELRTTLAGLPAAPIIFSGHSLGGALATLAYYDLAPAYQGALLYTFGAPRVGNPAFATTLDQGTRIFRYFNTEDAIPSLPPPIIFDYIYEQNNQNYVFTANLGTYAENHTQAYLESLKPPA